MQLNFSTAPSGNQPTVFTFDKMDVRVINKDGEPWFVAQDVCEALAHSDTSMAVRRLDEDEKGTSNVCTLSGIQEMLTINESGLYSLILTSRKPAAKRFKKWVTAEVLPSIRKTGSYTVGQPQPPVALPQDYIEALEHLLLAKKAEQLAIAQRDEAIRTKAQIGDRKTATAMATASAATKKANKLEIELDRSRQYATVKRMEMLYHGQSFNWRLLKSASADVGVPPVDVFDANYGKVKAYHADAWMEAYALPIVTNDCMALEQ